MARSEGCPGGLGAQDTVGERVGVEGEEMLVVVVVAGVGSLQFLCSVSFTDSFLDVMVMD